MLFNLILIFVGIACLYLGAESLVKGASSIATRLKVSPLVIGLTIVAFGTSMPEMVVSLKSNLLQLGGLSLGNILGSNIFNIAIILGLAALIRPLRTHIQLIRFDTPIMILVSLLLLLLFRDGIIGRWEGLGLFVGLVLYTVGTYLYALYEKRAERALAAQIQVALPRQTRGYLFDLVFITGGLVLLVWGSNLFIKRAIALAHSLQISDAIIGLTLAAAGTSLPELATSIVAAAKKQADLAIGNIVGSNIFNILGILGLTALISPIQAPSIQPLDFYWMLGTTIILLPIIITNLSINRLEGGLLLGSYILYVIIRL